MKKIKPVLNSNLGDLSQDLLSEFDETDLEDKKVSVFVTDKIKIKPDQEFVLLFVENLKNLLVNNSLTASELKVLLCIVQFSSFKNVFKITQKTIANDLGLDQAIVSRTMKKLREKNFLLKDEDKDIEYVNPYLFLKGSVKDFKQTDLYKQVNNQSFDELKKAF